MTNTLGTSKVDFNLGVNKAIFKMEGYKEIRITKDFRWKKVDVMGGLKNCF